MQVSLFSLEGGEVGGVGYGGGGQRGRTGVVRGRGADKKDGGKGLQGGGVRRGDKTCREGVVDRLMLSVSLCCVCSCEVCVCVCVRGYSAGHSPDHQINFHSDIPALPKPENTTTGSMNACAPFLERKRLLYIHVQNSSNVPVHTKIGVRP